MGRGIAQVVAEAGTEVLLYDAEQSALDEALSSVRSRWDRLLESGRRTPDEVSRAAANLTAGTLEDAAAVDLIIEAIIEQFPAKAALFEQLASIARSETILASNTSSISISALGHASGRPGRVVGLHFFNPVPALPLVEVVRGLDTSAETIDASVAFARALGKNPVVVNDAPGFVANRILLPMINEAIFTLQDGVASREAIDDVMKLGTSHPMGPLALADLIGLDVCLAILETLQHDLGEDKYRPAPLLRRMVAAGKLGRKSGEGFYAY
jgi:3-hydroxybutyryl-CoA dehydrogenase